MREEGEELNEKLGVEKLADTLRGPVIERFCGVAVPDSAPPNPANI